MKYKGDMMTLDEMLLWHGAEHRTLKSYLMPSFLFWLASMGVVIPIEMGLGIEKVAAIIMLCLAPWATISLIQMMIAFNIKCKYWDSLSEAIDRVPYWKREMAEGLEEDWETAWLWAIECEEAHINDCPLCITD